jgi:hypothetical protein
MVVPRKMIFVSDELTCCTISQGHIMRQKADEKAADQRSDRRF